MEFIFYNSLKTLKPSSADTMS